MYRSARFLENDVLFSVETDDGFRGHLAAADMPHAMVEDR
jgi:hypothetical protein